MSEPMIFSSTTARFALPLLFAAQAQKELFVNEGLARADALLHPVCEGIASTPSDNPRDGECWLVGTPASGAFAGREDALACRQQGQWLFAVPQDGMRVFDRALGKDRRYQGGWRAAEDVAVPAGGQIVDTEARAAIEAMLKALQVAGILG